MKKNNKKGLTLVELVVVIGVLAILAAIIIPVSINIYNNANRAVDESNATTMETAIKLYVAEQKVQGGTGDLPASAAAAKTAIESQLEDQDYNATPKQGGDFKFYYNNKTGQVVCAASDPDVDPANDWEALPAA